MEDELKTIENPEWTQYRIQEELKLKAEFDFKLKETEMFLKEQEKDILRDLKKKSFDLALSIKSHDYSAPFGNQQKSNYSVSNLISDANKIYEELIK